jgi:site-specific DNA-methyltransferase (adenine-specific)
MQVVSIADIFAGRTPKLPPLPEPQYGTAHTPKKKDKNQLEMLMPVPSTRKDEFKDAFVDPRFDSRLISKG